MSSLSPLPTALVGTWGVGRVPTAHRRYVTVPHVGRPPGVMTWGTSFSPLSRHSWGPRSWAVFTALVEAPPCTSRVSMVLVGVDMRAGRIYGAFPDTVFLATHSKIPHVTEALALCCTHEGNFSYPSHFLASQPPLSPTCLGDVGLSLMSLHISFYNIILANWAFWYIITRTDFSLFSPF